MTKTKAATRITIAERTIFLLTGNDIINTLAKTVQADVKVNV